MTATADGRKEFIHMECMNISSEELAKRLAAVKVGSRVMATQSGKYSFKRGVVTADEGSSFRVKFDETELGEYSIPKGKIVPLNSRACNSTNPIVRNAMNAVH